MRILAAAGKTDIGLAGFTRPLTTQPMIETVIGSSIWSSRSSMIRTVSMTSNCWRAQEGREITVTPRWRRPSDDHLKADTHFFGRIGGKRHPDRITDPRPEQVAKPDR